MEEKMVLFLREKGHEVDTLSLSSGVLTIDGINFNVKELVDLAPVVDGWLQKAETERKAAKLSEILSHR